MDRTDIRLKEYDTLRAEILASIGNRNSVLSFGVGMIAIMLAASIAVPLQGEKAVLAGVLLALGIPMVAFFVLLLWFSEYRRAHRAGMWIAQLEQKVNVDCKEPVLNWETHLSATPIRRYPSNATVLFLLFLSFFSMFVGAMRSALPPRQFGIGVVSSFFVHVVVFIIAARSLRKMAHQGKLRYDELRRPFDESKGEC